jgi:AraC-like DNA-binding protein
LNGAERAAVSVSKFRRLAGVSPQSYRNTFRERIAG